MAEFLFAFVLFYLWHGLGITVGYHRLLAHGSFKCPKWVEYFWFLGGYLSLQGSPIWWAANHRTHHRYTESPLDPHSPRQGFGHAYYGWVIKPAYLSHVDPSVLCKDLLTDPLYRFLEQNGNIRRALWFGVVVNILFRVALFLFFGWSVTLASTVALLFGVNLTMFVVTLCHIPHFGYKTYAGEDDSVNVWWLGWLGMGEGWHNNHHAFPGSARQGLKRYEVDLSWLVIRAMRGLGWAHSVVEATPGRLAQTHLLQVS